MYISAYICTPFTNTPVDTPLYNDDRHSFTIYTTYRDGGESEGCRLVLAWRPTFHTTLLAPPPLPSPQLFMEISRHAVLLLAVFNNKKVNEICGWSRKGLEEVRGGRRERESCHTQMKVCLRRAVIWEHPNDDDEKEANDSQSIVLHNLTNKVHVL